MNSNANEEKVIIKTRKESTCSSTSTSSSLSNEENNNDNENQINIKERQQTDYLKLRKTTEDNFELFLSNIEEVENSKEKKSKINCCKSQQKRNLFISNIFIAFLTMLVYNKKV